MQDVGIEIEKREGGAVQGKNTTIIIRPNHTLMTPSSAAK